MLENLKNKAKELNGETAVFTFHPHPRAILFPNELPPQALSTIEEKAKLLEKAGISHLVLYSFSKEFSKLTAKGFIETILHKQLQVKYLLVGHDHRFGSDKVSDLETIKKHAQEFNILVSKAEMFNKNEITISSSKIRKKLQKGEIYDANLLLGYNYKFTGKVVKGLEIGRTLGFPTANVQIKDKSKLLPLPGVYSVEIQVLDKAYKGMLNIGNNPTIGSNKLNQNIEVHIFDFNKNIYNKEITISFVKYIRKEEKFDNLIQLKQQLAQDMKSIKGIV